LSGEQFGMKNENKKYIFSNTIIVTIRTNCRFRVALISCFLNAKQKTKQNILK
jgi:hypothetical protein